jgi:xanthine dehydrogenase small subunit
MFDLPPCRLDAEPVVKALNEILDQSAAPVAHPPIAGATPAASFHTPRSIDELAALRVALPQARLLAGGTDIGLWVNKQFRELGDIIYLGKVQALQRISLGQDALYIGAGASLEDAWSALAKAVPSLTEVWRRFASPPIRHAGTMGGNLANGSPIGDSAPVLMALDANVELRRGNRVRQLPAARVLPGLHAKPNGGWRVDTGHRHSTRRFDPAGSGLQNQQTF